MSVQFKHVLVPTDFEEAADCALDTALALAERFGAQVTLLHVQQVPRANTDVEALWPSEELAASAQRAIDAAVAGAAKRYALCQGALRVGSPGAQIVAAAEEYGADIIVMGTRKRRGLRHALLGSVAERVVRTSPVPVLTVGRDENAADGQRSD